MVLLNHSNDVARNYDMFVGYYEISINVIVKHVQHFGIIRGFYLPRGTYYIFSA